ncbi:MAG: hypothetical protein E2590_00090 [Chryseobacterium sp.]|uniref:hypothetical protein n=1 Tax=Epilithonimonas caeni TaxID=365343 RepID=UPI00047F6DC0|nr:hypothetical protein [Epilithonimonas caeni]MPS71531.1 hypothetical protein [Chryseobacterium sp.]
MDTEISYFDFKNLSSQDQCQLVTTQGQIINESSKSDLRFVIYKLGSFLVEITYIQQNNKLASFNVYQNTYAPSQSA